MVNASFAHLGLNIALARIARNDLRVPVAT